MKSTLPILFVFAVLFSCSRGNDPVPNPNPNPPNPPTNQNSGIGKQHLVGWWNSIGTLLDYKRRYFGADSSYIQDMTNLGFGTSTGKWWWGNGDTLYVFVATGPVNPSNAYTLIVQKLTADSLRFRWGPDSRGYYK